MTLKKMLAALAVAVIAAPSVLSAQATGTPSYNAPYRAFVHHEFGGTVSFPEGTNWALEGQYRFGTGPWDIGLRGGLLEPGGGASTVFLVGAEGRARVINHTEDFPIDGAFILGAGFNFDGGTTFLAPVGLSLGRRLDIQNSNLSVIPYAQPTLFFVAGGGTTDLQFGLGLGADLRLSRAADFRFSASLGDIRGVALSLVFIR
jgi:hypothetical protein